MRSSTGVTAQYFLKQTDYHVSCSYNQPLLNRRSAPHRPVGSLINLRLRDGFTINEPPPPPPECAGVGRALPLLNTQ